ncbi:hypothetical protein GCM10023346_37760 [Arthrobacter gyeryongensis]|uniref:Uncharacterized protein n=1 Tax=Arthrobacter gyeryongensis TaxID=1650592 RepID=A0ABP9SMB8_9MICC
MDSRQIDHGTGGPAWRIALRLRDGPQPLGKQGSVGTVQRWKDVAVSVHPAGPGAAAHRI